MKQLTIALLGNTNNYPLLLAEGFIKLGHHVRLLVNRKELLHRPESKYPQWQENYPDWIIDFSDVTEYDRAYETPAIDEIVNQLTNGVDLVILNDIGHSYATYLKCPHVSFLTGSDLSYFANYDSIVRRTATWDPAFRRSNTGCRLTRKLTELVMMQREGILTASKVSFGLPGMLADGDNILESIGIVRENRIMIRLSDLHKLERVEPVRNENLVILNGGRVLWRQVKGDHFFSIDLKGTDILIRGFALYCQAGGKGELRMFRKGGDVGEATRLMEELAITSRVKWLDEMSLEQFHQELPLADIICDQFANSFPGMVTSDAFALGRPVLANLRNEIFSRHYPEPMPGLQAATPEQVCERLLYAEANREWLRELGNQSRAYAEKYLAPVKMAEMLLAECNL